MKELTFKDIDDGVIVVGPSGFKYKVHRVQCQLTHGDSSPWFRELEIGLKGHNYFEPAAQPKSEEENIMKKEFSKGDLRSGMKVVLRNGLCRTVFKDTFEEGTVIVANSGAWSKLEDYDQNFCFEDRSLCELDIDIIYTVYTYEMLCNTSIKDAKEILWKREEKTQEQLAYEALQAQIAEEEARHADSIKALREQAEKLKPKIGG